MVSGRLHYLVNSTTHYIIGDDVNKKDIIMATLVQVKHSR